MGLAFVFNLSIYVLTGFVGLVLGMAEYGPIPFVSFAVAVFAYWWCEIGAERGIFRRRGLGETPAMVMGFLALLAATIEFFGESPEGKLLAGIHLIVYLTWIVLLQPKTNYRYWLLLALGVMHVAVGSVLTNSAWYGLCMVIYLFAAIWTLSVFSLYRVALDFAAIDPEQQVSSVSEPGATNTGEVFNGVRFENNEQWISLRLVSGVTLTATAGVVVGGLFFALIPRVWVGAELGISDESLPPAMRRNVTGQASEIHLGDLNRILTSNDPVLKIRLFNNETDQPISVQTYAEWLGLREPLFRGAVLTDYAEGSWRPERPWGTSSKLQAEPDDSSIAPVVRQEIHLERIGASALLCLGRAVAMCDPVRDRVGRLQPSGIVTRLHWFEQLSGAVDYLAFSPLPPVEVRRSPGMVATTIELNVYKVSKYFHRCIDVPEVLVRLRALTRRVLDAEERKTGTPLTDVQKARAIESYLRDSGEFSYSLTAGAADHNVDLVEDFLFRHRAGHCQYFASALVLMIRSAGIPARLVTGFKGGEELPNGTFNVEKRFAHAWVEAWVENRKWMTFDATPEEARDESVNAIGTKRNFFSSMTTWMGSIWESNVLDLTPDRQDYAFYQPMRDLWQRIVKFVQGFWNSPRSSLIGIFSFVIDPRNWLTIPGGLTLSLLVGFLWLLRRKTTWLRRRTAEDRTESDRQRIEFYERFVLLTKSLGRTRQLGQTQGEFVTEVADDLSVRLSDSVFGESLASIGDLFYRVRFGNGELTSHEKSALDDLLDRLEQELNSPPGKRMQRA